MRPGPRTDGKQRTFTPVRLRAVGLPKTQRPKFTVPSTEAGLKLLDVLDAVSTRLRHALGDTPERRAAADPVYERIAEWLKIVPSTDLFTLTVEDIIDAYPIGTKTMRITKFPMTPIPVTLLQKTNGEQMRITEKWQIPWCVRTLFFEEDGTIVDEARWKAVSATFL